MHYVLVSLGIALAVVLGLRAFLRASPALLAQRLRAAAGLVLFAFAILLLLRGQVHVAALLLAVGLPILAAGPGGLFKGRRKAPGQVSQIETALLRTRLDHDSGVMTGEVIAGPLAGRALATLGREELLLLLASCRTDDPKSAALLEAYLDHSHPDWRDTPAGDGPQPHQGPAGPLTPGEARKILGVGPQADDEEIRAAWREQMKRNHPDQGGSSYLAAKINEAKDVLLEKGR